MLISFSHEIPRSVRREIHAPSRFKQDEAAGDLRLHDDRAEVTRRMIALLPREGSMSSSPKRRDSRFSGCGNDGDCL